MERFWWEDLHLCVGASVLGWYGMAILSTKRPNSLVPAALSCEVSEDYRSPQQLRLWVSTPVEVDEYLLVSFSHGKCFG